MPLSADLQVARRLLRNAWGSRRARRRLDAVTPTLAAPAPGSIQIGVYFADTAVNLYQLRQWYGPLAELARRWPVAIISRSPGATLALLRESPVPVINARTVRDLERFVTEQDLRIVLYVNQNAKNFQMFRYGRLWHVFINHGESDKMYMTTNQYKAYDYALIAGDAARSRLERVLWDYDFDKRAIAIGRPQTDHLTGEHPYPDDDRTVVLYAPTWEGDRDAAAYGSIASHGVALANAVLASPRHRLVYRPHPRSGVVDAAYGRANEAIIAAIERANAADPAAHHVHDTGPLGWQLAAADLAITDISAMVYDRLATGRPLMVTRPVSPLAEVDTSGYLDDAEWLTADRAGEIVALGDVLLEGDEARRKLRYWVEHYFGDTSPGAPTRRFHAAIELLMDRWREFADRHPRDARAGLSGDDESVGG